MLAVQRLELRPAGGASGNFRGFRWAFRHRIGQPASVPVPASWSPIRRRLIVILTHHHQIVAMDEFGVSHRAKLTGDLLGREPAQPGGIPGGIVTKAACYLDPAVVVNGYDVALSEFPFDRRHAD